MDWQSAILGAFFAVSLCFGAIALALYPIMRQRFLFWIALRVAALAIMIWSLTIGLPNLPFLDLQQRILAGLVATDLSLAACGPFLADYIERRVPARRTRRWLRRMVPFSLVPIAMLPIVIYFGVLDWAHQAGVVALAGMLVWGMTNAIRLGSRAAIFQAIAWTPMLLVGTANMIHAIVFNAIMPHFVIAICIAVLVEFIVTSMGVADGFIRVRNERDRALADMRAAQLATALDPLTNIANRRGLERHFGNPHIDRPQGLAIIDCDHFKSVNDRFGHDVGDKVLCAVAQGLLGDGCFVARLGGEEFVVLLYGRRWRENGEAARRRITTAVREAAPDLPVAITASAGITEFRGEEGLPAAMKRADGALYAAKEAGRNRTVDADAAAPVADTSSRRSA